MAAVSSEFLKLFCVVALFYSGARALGNPVQTLPSLSTETSAGLPPRHFPTQYFDDKSTEYEQNEKTLPPKVFPKTITELIEQAGLKSTNYGTASSINSDTENSTIVLMTKKTSAQKVASEIPDLLNTDNFNRTEYNDGTELPLQNDTDTVEGPHVIKSNKTHEEDATVSNTEKTVEDKKSSSIKKDIDDKKNYTSKNKTSDEKSNTTVLPTTLTTTTNANVTSATDAKMVTQTTVKAEETVQHTTTSVNVTQAEGSIEKENGTVTTKLPNNEKNVTDATTVSHLNITVASTITPVNNVTEDIKKPAIPLKDDKDKKVKTKIDNKTTKEEIKKPEEATKGELKKYEETTKESITSKPSSTPIPEATTSAQTTIKVESTTSVNISENIIKHGEEVEDSPLALAASQQHADHSHATSGKSSAFLQPTESAAILAGVFVGIALLGYVGLLAWRRLLEKRYGNREMLVNEDDFYDSNDLRNFEL